MHPPPRPYGSGASAYASLANGVSLYEPSHPILATIARRKQTEKEVEALENRIKRLELEESKAKRGVTQVRERNQQVQQAVERSKRVAEERAALSRSRRAEIERLRELAQKRKETQRQNLQKAFTGMYNERLGEARQLREEQERVVEEAARAREREREKNFDRNDQIRNRRKEVSSRFEQQRIAHQVSAVDGGNGGGGGVRCGSGSRLSQSALGWRQHARHVRRAVLCRVRTQRLMRTRLHSTRQRPDVRNATGVHDARLHQRDSD
jgi:hypothetical protein